MREGQDENSRHHQCGGREGDFAFAIISRLSSWDIYPSPVPWVGETGHLHASPMGLHKPLAFVETQRAAKRYPQGIGKVHPPHQRQFFLVGWGCVPELSWRPVVDQLSAELATPLEEDKQASLE